MMVKTDGLPGLDLDGNTSLRSVGLKGLAGMGATNRESHPEIVAAAQKRLIAMGYKAECRETITPVPGGVAYYNRQCSVNGSPFSFGADYIPAMGDELGWRAFAVGYRTEMGLAQAPVQTSWAQAAVVPAVDPRAKGSGGTSSFVPPTYTPPATPPPATPPPATQKPQEKPATTQPGEVPANTVPGTADKMAAGAGDQNKTATDEGFFSSSIKIGDFEIPMVLLLAGAGVGLYMMTKGGSK